MVSEIPDILYCDKDEREFYDTLLDEEIFKGMDLKHVFMLAVVTGLRAGKRNELKKRVSGGLIRESYLDDSERAVISAIAVATDESGLKVLLDKRKVYQMAEEFASGGIQLLKNDVCSGEFGSYAKRLGERLVKEAKGLGATVENP